MKQRIYIDTSVFGGHYDEEFKEHTIPLFERIKDGEFIILYSTVTQDELENAPEKVVGRTSFTDCLHIALATINHADFLVSWSR